MDWKAVDERLVRRGELLLSLDFLDGYEDELRVMNGIRLDAHTPSLWSFYWSCVISSLCLTGSLKDSPDS